MHEAGLLDELEPDSNSFYSQIITHALPPLRIPSSNIHHDLLPPCASLSKAYEAQHTSVSQQHLPPFCENLFSASSTSLTALIQDTQTAFNLTAPNLESSFSWQRQARGRDGRFLPKGVIPCDIGEKERKQCGWCGTFETTQWRAGPSGSIGTLYCLVLWRYRYDFS